MERDDGQSGSRETVRSAEWRGAWRMFGGLMAVFVVAAILLPVFFQEKGEKPKLSGRYVATAIQRTRLQTGRWPTDFQEVRPQLKSFHPHFSHRVSFVKIADRGDEVEYAVACDQKLEAFLIDVKTTVKPLGRAASGTLPK